MYTAAQASSESLLQLHERHITGQLDSESTKQVDDAPVKEDSSLAVVRSAKDLSNGQAESKGLQVEWSLLGLLLLAGGVGIVVGRNSVSH